MGLRLAMLITFLVLGVLLTSIFWVAAWFLGLTGPVLLAGVIVFVFFMVFFQWLIGPAVIRMSVRMHECKDQRIITAVHAIAARAGVPKPRVYLVNNPVPNAFAFGRTQKSSNIALHTGLLERLSEEEVRAVIAHEIGHIKNRDVVVMTLASALPAILFYLIYFGVMMAGSRDRGGTNYLGAWAGGMIAQFLATLLVLYLSRVREYSADSFSAKATSRPGDLASALAKISYSLSHSKNPMPATMRSFYIADEVSSKYSSQMEHEKKRGWMELFMTHPLTYKRIRALERTR